LAFDLKQRDGALAPTTAVSEPIRHDKNVLVRALSVVRRSPGFFIVVVAPSIVATAFFGFIQSPIYTSNAEIMIKAPSQTSSLNGIGSFLQSAGITSTPSDSYTVNSYLLSRSVVKDLEKDPGIRQIYSRPEADFIDRFPNFFIHGSFESLFEHYTSWVSISFDSNSNITTLAVKAFRPIDAQRLAQRLITLSEIKANEINDRVREHGLKQARDEVASLQQKALENEARITSFRSREAVLDPNQASTQTVSLLASLESELVASRAALKQMQTAAPNSPMLPALQSRVSALEAQSRVEQMKGTDGKDSLAPKMAQYQQLTTEQQVLQQMLQSAVTAMEASSVSLQAQQIYIAPIAAPNLPDRGQSIYDRLLDIIISVSTFLLVYGIGRLLAAAVGDYVLQ
jgi:capsular polysaccharide transport system permease protein